MKDTHYYMTAAVIAVATMAGCSSQGSDHSAFAYQNLPVAERSATAGEGHSVAFKGAPMSLEGRGITVGEPLRDVRVAKSDLTLVNLADTKGKIRIISVVPSLDTKVCEQQTHHLSEKNQGLDKRIELMTISVDTPFAQSRFAKEAKIDNVTFFSDYRGGDFGRTHGLLVKDPHILARTIMVVDPNNIVRYLQITPELGQLPDMEAAFKAARALAENAGRG